MGRSTSAGDGSVFGPLGNTSLEHN
ncbi:uncharacterized protein G2W53_036833 [Senna tora]|uniref:Uncharacterized protein n=1 Tax=Senna tora TaxID=362788 RepID=A0A834SWK6_9FABA|nr:uncharacterized protein G2W53_036833 [Senna tora]